MSGYNQVTQVRGRKEGKESQVGKSTTKETNLKQDQGYPARHTHAHTSIHTGIVCRLYSIFACPYYFISDSPGEETALTWRLGGSSAECGPQACPESHGCTAAPGAGHCGFHLLPHRPGSLPSFVLVSHDCSFSVMISRGDWQAL